MRLCVGTEHRFDRTPDGDVWTQTMYGHSYWTRYLDVFDQVRVIARVQDVQSVPSDWIRASGHAVSFAPVPYYIGPIQYLRRASRVKRATRNAIKPSDAVLLYVAGRIASCIDPVLNKIGHPYGVYVIGDPYDTFAPGSVKHPLRIFFRWSGPRSLRHQCTTASAAAYITEYSLQRRYPPSPKAFTTHFAMGEMSDETFVLTPRIFDRKKKQFTLIHVGTMEQLYKAQDVLIKAFSACIREGLDLKLIFVGDGQYRPELERLAETLGISNKIQFAGQLTAGESVRIKLDEADLFVLPSHQEGLPRAMIEAMARALPAIGSTVGGFPELIDRNDLVQPGDLKGLTTKIREVVTNPARMMEMSARNLEKAKSYGERSVRKRRNEFYSHIKKMTELWQKNCNAG